MGNNPLWKKFSNGFGGNASAGTVSSVKGDGLTSISRG